MVARETDDDSTAAQAGPGGPAASLGDSGRNVAVGTVAPPQAATATPPAPPPALSDMGRISAQEERARLGVQRAARYMVEVHKKWALSLACFPFVLLAVALALRFPRGGMGLVIGGAMFVYAVFYVGLTAGESLADRQLISPAVAMWSPNAILLVLAVAGLVSVHRESGSTRGGDLHEIGDFFRRLVPRRRR
jgi:lipopolysaccharide export system permease protein